MKILVVHDRPEMLKEIRELLDEANSGYWTLETAEDFVGAIRHLQAVAFDIAIIDLTIPHMKGKGPADYQVAEHLLQQAMDDPDLHPPGDILGLTVEKEALGRIDSMIGANLMAVVEEDREGAWRQDILDRLNYCARHVAARQRSLFSRHEYDVVIVTALDKEFEPYTRLLDLTDVPHAAGYFSFSFKDSAGVLRKGIAHSIGRAGQAAAASSTQAAVTQFRPKLSIMSGICGGIEGKVNLGDVLIAESVFDWDYGKWKEANNIAKFHPRPEPITIRGTVTERIARAAANGGTKLDPDCLKLFAEAGEGSDLPCPQLRLAPFASGSAVVGANEILRRIEQLNDNIAAIDMEAFAFHFAATQTPVVRGGVLCVKSVSDFANPAKDDRFHSACCELSARTAIDILQKHVRFSPAGVS